MNVDPAPPPPQQQPAAAGANNNSAAASSSLVGRFRSILLTFFSFALTALVVGNAYYQRQQFYPSVVYIIKSNPR